VRRRQWHNKIKIHQALRRDLPANREPPAPSRVRAGITTAITGTSKGNRVPEAALLSLGDLAALAINDG
jgi:hypothetical protein